MSSASSNGECSDRVNLAGTAATVPSRDAKASTLRLSGRPAALRPELLNVAEPILPEENTNSSDPSISEQRNTTVGSRHGSTTRVSSGRGPRPSRRGSLVVCGRSPNAAMAEARNASNTNLFIRNLHPDVEQCELDDLFRTCGTILSSAVMRNIHTGESLGTGFVRFATHEQAKAAMTEFNGHKLHSKSIIVQWAKKHDGAPVGEARRLITKLFVRNIPLDITVPELTALFSQHGPISQVTIHKDTSAVEDKSLERHIAFVIYTVEGAAEQAATAIHNTKPFDTCNGIPLMVKLAEDNYNRHDRGNNSSNAMTPLASNALGAHRHHNDTPGMGPRLSPGPAGLDLQGSFRPQQPAPMGIVPYGAFYPPSPMGNHSTTHSLGTPLCHVSANGVVMLSSPTAASTSTPVSGRTVLHPQTYTVAGMPMVNSETVPVSPFAAATAATPTTASARTPRSLGPQPSFTYSAAMTTSPVAKGPVLSGRRRSYSGISGASNQTPTCFNRDTSSTSLGVSPVGAPVRTASQLPETTNSGSSGGLVICGIPAPRSSTIVQTPVLFAVDAPSSVPKSPSKVGYRHDPYSMKFSAVSA